jgi:hypothetical protein
MTPDGLQHGFLYAGGHHALFDAPDCFQTAFWDANDWWQIVGMGLSAADSRPVTFVFMGGIFYAIAAPHAAFTDMASINNAAQMGGAVTVTNVDGVEPHFVTKGLVLTLLSLDTAGLAAPAQIAHALPLLVATTAPQVGPTLRGSLDPCAPDDGSTMVPLKLRGLCLR